MEIVVLGVPRSGTSMVGGLLRILGVYFGEDIKADKHEDQEFFRKSVEEMAPVIEKRNAEHDVWGWKDPWIGRTIAEVFPCLQEPRFVFIERDAEQAIESDMRRNKNVTYAYARMRNERLMMRIRGFMAAHPDIDVLCLNYEDVLRNREETVNNLISFLGASVSEDVRQAAIGFIERGYRRIPSVEPPSAS